MTDGVLRDGSDTRERLAALITSPRNKRFAEVIVNRMWRRYFGRGLVEPVDDWEHAEPSHPDLLKFLARELVLYDYDLKHMARLMLNSHAYQRQPGEADAAPAEGPARFAAARARRMTAEQLVDSLFVASGKLLDAGPMNIDVDTARTYRSSLNLGLPTRAWHFTSLSNERDRPSLALPFAQPFVTVLETFGWRASRQDPLTVRDQTPTVLRPALLANGIVGRRLTTLSDDNDFTVMARREQSLQALIDQLYLSMLTRRPTQGERSRFEALLRPGYEDRRREAPLVRRPRLRRGLVSWSNHLDPEANVIKVELQEAVRQGDPPTARLEPDWRERMEDALWALMNSPEFLFLP